MNIESQTKSILNHLNSGKSISGIEALNMFGCFRLPARIYDLKNRGIAIDSEMVHKDGKKWSEYSIKKVDPQ
jgi:hypothetical protein